jgi:hypothetical protein
MQGLSETTSILKPEKKVKVGAVELQECDLLDSTPLDNSVHDHLLYS